MVSSEQTSSPPRQVPIGNFPSSLHLTTKLCSDSQNNIHQKHSIYQRKLSKQDTPTNAFNSTSRRNTNMQTQIKIDYGINFKQFFRFLFLWFGMLVIPNIQFFLFLLLSPLSTDERSAPHQGPLALYSSRSLYHYFSYPYLYFNIPQGRQIHITFDHRF